MMLSRPAIGCEFSLICIEVREMNELSEFSLLADFQRSNANIVPSLDSLRWLVRNRRLNGLSASGAVVKRQGRIYMHESRFADWMQSGAEISDSAAA